MSRQLREAERRLRFADRLVGIGKVTLAVYLVLVTTILMFQLYSVQQKLIEDNAAQHEKTQSYILCIAEALLRPLATRSEALFDDCGIGGASAPAQQQAQSAHDQSSSTPTDRKA